jgi:hypothetical protein
MGAFSVGFEPQRCLTEQGTGKVVVLLGYTTREFVEAVCVVRY